ncbi:EthD domain-containing protein [Rhodococcus sp. USK10]|uniref:EthD domain-containing protein n=1 Tax=Rhodococcus TaxID=1827 RepID=UPI000F579E8F|nr:MULTISPECIES: EthD domain-containing protein [Rhodococcus]QYB04712.1 EthD domain-containing protein [Rhodococcus sp. USK10]
MIKMVALMKRRADLTLDEFIERYENGHAPFADKYLPTARHYQRRYIQPLGNPIDGSNYEPDFDVVTEIWFDDQSALEEALGRISEPEVAALFAADEEELFDRVAHRLFTVAHESRTDRPSA